MLMLTRVTRIIICSYRYFSYMLLDKEKVLHVTQPVTLITTTMHHVI